MYFWMCVGLCFVIVLHFVAMAHSHWYIVNLDLNRCMSCGKLIVTFGELLENMTNTSGDMTIHTVEEVYNLTDIDTEVDYTTERNIVHDLQTYKYDTNDDQVIETFTIENHILIYIGLLKNLLCTEHQTFCINIDHGVARSAFGSIHSLQIMQDTIPWVTLCKYLSTVVLLVTIAIVAFDFVNPRAAIVGFSLYSLFSLGAVIIASVPYFVFSAYDVISLCVPWAHVLTLFSAYISGIMVYNLLTNKRVTTEQALTMWQMRNVKLV